VVEIDRDLPLELCKLCGKNLRRHMEADIGDVLETVWEGDLGDYRGKIRGRVRHLPDPLGGAGVGGENNTHAILAKEEAGGGHDVIDFDGLDLEITRRQAADRKRMLDLHLIEPHRRIEMVGNPGEVWPGVVVEKMPANPREHSFGAKDRNRFIARTKRVLDQERQGVCVVHVGVCDQNVADLPLFFDRQRPRDGARIHGHAAVDQEGGHPAFGAIASETPENSKFHAPSIPAPSRLP